MLILSAQFPQHPRSCTIEIVPVPDSWSKRCASAAHPHTRAVPTSGSTRSGAARGSGGTSVCDRSGLPYGGRDSATARTRPTRPPPPCAALARQHSLPAGLSTSRRDRRRLRASPHRWPILRADPPVAPPRVRIAGGPSLRSPWSLDDSRVEQPATTSVPLQVGPLQSERLSRAYGSPSEMALMATADCECSPAAPQLSRILHLAPVHHRWEDLRMKLSSTREPSPRLRPHDHRVGTVAQGPHFLLQPWALLDD